MRLIIPIARYKLHTSSVWLEHKYWQAPASAVIHNTTYLLGHLRWTINVLPNVSFRSTKLGNALRHLSWPFISWATYVEGLVTNPTTDLEKVLLRHMLMKILGGFVTPRVGSLVSSLKSKGLATLGRKSPANICSLFRPVNWYSKEIPANAL